MIELNAAVEGLKVDSKNPKTGKWLPATIVHVEKASYKDIKVEVKYDGYPEEFN